MINVVCGNGIRGRRMRMKINRRLPLYAMLTVVLYREAI